VDLLVPGAELTGDGEDLALALAPLAAGIDEEKAHPVILAQLTRRSHSG
jgi:hypothetical protein